MKGYVIKWRYDECYERPIFGIWQVPANCIKDFDVIDIHHNADLLALPFSYIEVHIIARNKDSAISKFAEKYHIPIKGNTPWK